MREVEMEFRLSLFLGERCRSFSRFCNQPILGGIAHIRPRISLITRENSNQRRLLPNVSPGLCILHCGSYPSFYLDHREGFRVSITGRRREDVDRVVEIVDDQGGV
jgi:hypothetical protein